MAPSPLPPSFMSTKLSVPPHSIPDEKTVSAAAELELLDKHGNTVRFGDLFKSQKTIVVFVRHFYCGSCQSYVQALASVPQEALAAANARIIVIGCGEAQPIEMYANTTGFRDDDIYANPSRSIYYALGMDIGNKLNTPAGVERRSYMPKSDFMNMISSIFRIFMHPTSVGKQGDTAQLGGDFIFGPGNTCSFASRMEHTADHVEVADLMEAAGVEMV